MADARLDSVLVKRWTSPRSQLGKNPFSEHRVRHVLSFPNAGTEQEVAWALARVAQGGLAQHGDFVSDRVKGCHRQINSSTQLPSLLREYEQFLLEAGAPASLVNSFAPVVDDLVVNALYHGPTGPDGKRIYAGLSRDLPVNVGDDINIIFFADDNHYGVIVKDPFGSLAPDEVTEILDQCIAEQAEELIMGKGHGLFSVVQRASRVIFNLAPGNFSEIVVLRRCRESEEAFQQTSPAINICIPRAPAPVDLRRYERTSVSNPALLLLDGVSSPVMQIVDASRRGVRLMGPEVNQGIAPGQLVSLAVLNSQSLTVKPWPTKTGNVLWTMPSPDYRLGEIRWINEDPNSESRSIGVQLTDDLDVSKMLSPGTHDSEDAED